jgi:hypothetical protein
VPLVLVEAVGSSVTPFVPVPFVDDYLLERLLQRIARKVIEKQSDGPRPEAGTIAKAVAEGYMQAGSTPLGQRAFTAAARFVARKVAVILDVKRSHDVFGEAIAFALALDVALELDAVHPHAASHVGAAIFRSRDSVGSAAIEVLTRAGRGAFKATESSGQPESSRFARVSEAIGREVDDARARLDHLMRYELGQAPKP